jgi:hypothetical protein
VSCLEEPQRRFIYHLLRSTMQGIGEPATLQSKTSQVWQIIAKMASRAKALSNAVGLVKQ